MQYLSWFVGLPALICSVVVALIGVISKRASLVLLGAILIAPFSWYQAWYVLMIAVPLILLGASIAIRWKKNELSWILFLLAFLDIVSWVITAIHSQ